jgi:mono/diheme cytochrome c family protein
MHIVFGVSSVVLFATTIWLLAADHYREWKGYQTKFQKIENWTLSARAAEQRTIQYEKELRRLQEAVYRAQASVPSKSLVNRFRAQVLYYQASERGTKAPSASTEADFAKLESIDFQRDPSLLDVPANAKVVERLVKHLVEYETADDTGIEEAYTALADVAVESSEGDDAAAAAEQIGAPRGDLLGAMREQIRLVRFVEETTGKQLKSARANLDEMKSRYGAGVRDSRDQLKGEVEKEIEGDSADSGQKKKISALEQDFQLASSQRLALEGILRVVERDVATAEKNLKDHQAALVQLHATLAEKSAKTRRVLEMPILDAFGSPLRINQIWLPDLTIYNNFRDVARFDRCTTCHLAIDKTAPGSAVDPAYPVLRDPIETVLQTPGSAPESYDAEADADVKTQAIFGLQLSAEGVVEKSDVVVEFVWKGQAGANAGLQRGDVITHVEVGDRMERVRSRVEAMRFLIGQVTWGHAVRLRVQRGMPHPFSSHPRLDLFVGSLSPHQLQDFGCTICHDGQGSATAFKWASHMPNDPTQAHEWATKHGWFDNHHWIFPMQPQRFVESGCLKCHHDVVDLEPSPRFPDPPAPKLLSGYKLIRKYGCYGCHEINGFDGPDRRVGPDLRTEPQYYAAGQQLAFNIDLLTNRRGRHSETEATELAAARGVAEEVSWHPERDVARRELYEFVKVDADRAKAVEVLLKDSGLVGDARALAEKVRSSPRDAESRKALAAMVAEDAKLATPLLSDDTHSIADLIARRPLLAGAAHKLSEVLKDSATPGTLRKVGPSLRYVKEKMGRQSIFNWIMNPQDIRPTSKMPRFFGLHKTHHHLSKEEEVVADQNEKIEVQAITTYLFLASQRYQYAPSSPDLEKADAARGQEQFETRGCLACHQHQGSPDAVSTYGPNLTDLAKKLGGGNSKKWLRSWLLDPSRYHRRTNMPNLFLTPKPLLGDDGKPLARTDADGNPQKNVDGEVLYKMTDPAADIALYLLGPDQPSSDLDASLLGDMNELDLNSLKDLATENLKTVFSRRRAEQYVVTGIPNRLASTLKGAEVELLIGNSKFENVKNYKLMRYLGRRSIAKYGCAGCHDIPGFEGAKPIGTGLADWGRKETTKLAFEHIVQYIEKHQLSHGAHGDGGGHHALDPAELDEPDGYFIQSLLSHGREGFLRQKLLRPRSYDYEKTANKGYDERLRMPQFPWGAQAEHAARKRATAIHEEDGRSIEAAANKGREEGRNREIEEIMTFVLGLVSEPPNDKYIYKAAPRQAAIVRGERVLQKYNCAGCHVMELDRWDLSFRPERTTDDSQPSDSLPSPVPSDPTYSFVTPNFTSQQIADSERTDRSGKLHASLSGIIKIGNDGHPEQWVWVEEEGDFLPLEEFLADFEGEPGEEMLPIEVWQPALVNGGVQQVKSLVNVPKSMIDKHYPAKGGDFARLLMPISLPLAKKLEPSFVGPDAWAWGPPPLVGQGRKTRPEWLREFLLNPYPIRPAVILRMPKFNMTPAEAEALVQYFEARDSPGYPDHFVAETSEADLVELEADYQLELAALRRNRRREAGGNAGGDDQVDPLAGNRFGHALNIVIHGKAGCIQCHGVNDKVAEGNPRGNGPSLDGVYKRLKPDYIKRWIAKPSMILPYTKMAELIPYKPGGPNFGGFEPPILGPDGKPLMDGDGNPITDRAYHGTSEQQLDAVRDLLSNFDRYMKSETSIQEKIVQQPTAAPAAEEPPAAE